MALKSALNAEMKRLKGDAKSLEKKRAEITADIDRKIAENASKQEMLQSFMDATFGTKPKSPASPVEATGGTRRKRKNRKGVRQRVLRAVSSSSGGIKRNAILEELKIGAADKAGHQYVSNTLRALFDDGLIERRGRGRVYFPKGSGEAQAVTPSDSADSEGDNSPESATPDTSSDIPNPSSSRFGSI